MTEADTEAVLDELCRILLGSIGPARGVTIDALTKRLGLPRRATEQLIQLHLGQIPCCVVAGSNGYYRPTRAQHINGYIHNLRLRHEPLVTREKTVVRKARSENWPEQSGLFIDRPGARQPELFA